MTILTKKDLIEAIMNINRNKNELIKDLCSRLPYGVKVQMSDGAIEELINVNVSTFICNGLKGLPKPYLFPLSSMTEEQERELIDLTGYKSECTAYCGFDSMGYYIKNVGEFEYEEDEHSFIFYPDYVGLDWFNKNHFDYRGLIEKGLAIDATGLNIY